MLKNWKNLLKNMPVDDADAAVEEIAQRVVKDGMGSAAIVFLETSKPISFITGQFALAATPVLGGFIEPMRLEKYADLFTDRRFIERLIQRIEELEEERAGFKKKKAEKTKDEGQITRPAGLCPCSIYSATNGSYCYALFRHVEVNCRDR